MTRNKNPWQVRSEADLTGDLWYSEIQWYQLREAGRDRTFGRVIDTGAIVEYTEMVTLETLIDEPWDKCGYTDAKFVGRGTFDHFEDEDGYRY